MMLYFALSPLLIVAVGAMALMLAEALSRAPTRNQDTAAGLALGASVVFFAGFFCSVGVWLYGVENIDGLKSLEPWLTVDKFTLFFEGLMCLAGGLATLLAGGYLREHKLERGEFYTLLLFSGLGAMILAASTDVLTLFLGLETMSLGVYALTAFRRGSARSIEGALKYFLLGSFAAAILLYGFALLYGATGHTDLAGIGVALRTGAIRNPMVVIALVLLVAGLAFKVSAVPFHMWTPDAYEGAPTPATTFMAVVVKAGGFAMMMRVLLVCFGDPRSMSWAAGWPPVLAWLAAITMTVANLVAGRQESVKRMLAYSSIAHAGYLLVGMVATIRTPGASGGMLFYLVTYTVSTVGAFGALILCGRRGAEAVSYEDLAGIGRRHPAAALPFALFLVSLAGIPPTAGFFGKWFLFRNAIEGGFHWLTIIAFLNSVLAAYYYLRVLVFMYMREPAAGAPVATPMRSGYVNGALVLCAVFVIALGVMPTRTLEVALEAAAALVHG